MNQSFIWRRRALKFAASALCVAVAAPAVQAQPAAPIRLALIESMSGPFANTGEAVFRNILWAVERVNARGGVKLPGGARLLQLDRYDSKGQNEEALSALRAAMDDGARIVLQGNSSATAAALVDAIDKNNERDPSRRVIFLNYSAVDPVLTNERCSFWHFRFDAHADMRVTALMDVVKDDASLKRVYLIGQDYSFGQAVLRESKRQLTALRPDVQVVGDELHPMGRVKDFSPYATKIIASGAQAVMTGNWGNDLTLLVKAAREAGFNGSFYTFYGNALGAPAAIGDAGIGRVIAVADWLPNVQTAPSEAFYQSFRARFPKPSEDYVHMRMQLLVESLAQAIERAGSTDTVAVARALERADVTLAGQRGRMRAADHQFQQQLVVGMMDKQGAPGVKFDVEGSGYGFRVVKTVAAERAEMPTTCKMQRP
ncbi:branched-chain amino acid ABC transporter substrate-binding protein [Variovorax arabinosiphilus]|uniref:branched-chain amino acid ABC transporter substrate-binding protein n=1 Tax=Variovorax arabinosiphilus TaxID=3053498 RepID=UPI002577FE6E|nr:MULTISPECIES: branched-chain amino acid ABC transporter substrate-binding protein [unclassified Variovorax]MDM0119492.1 branched-chain amino acid ABC transporter substrate-binding protein [Variovorax sp. J2L1-78]MDM0129918.1 branched-chain amino acid ABC transporter substrate-binding protein [Variovorax sp. J2L1-63]MDM0232296.1 branched-chain amino acid ABC transporter substrate-binding protein [Variovorax sp. J2R1-6]